MKILFKPIFILFLTTTSFAQETMDSFNQGLLAYQKNDFQSAQQIFSELYEKNPNSPQLMFNLGLSEYHLGKKGMALGLWRKARFLSSQKSPIDQAINFVEEELSLTSNNGSMFTYLSVWLQKIPTQTWFIITIFLSFFLGWRAIDLFAKRKTPFREWPLWIFLLAPVWFFTFCLSSWLMLVEIEPKATIIEADIPTRTGPADTFPSLSTLSEGLVVQIIKTHNDWAQVQPSSGPPGWVLKNQIIAIKDLGE